MSEKYRCVHQISDPGVKLPKYFSDMFGIGDCSKCVYDPVGNPKCGGYYPVKVFEYEVLKESSKKKESSKEKEEKKREQENCES